MVNEATAKARRSEALFRSSNAGISRRWLTDKVADLEWECARLRVQLDDATASNGRLEERCSKLRELARDYLIFYSQPGCTYCFCHDECRESEETCMAFERLVDRTNELGIEVNE